MNYLAFKQDKVIKGNGNVIVQIDAVHKIVKKLVSEISNMGH